tara:strand:+ start:409 stop:561 length:153 start_codon:yes stop_codon:yes gene_type:complete
MNFRDISISERFSIGPLLGWSFFNPDDDDPFYELNIYLIFFMLHFAWDYD